MSRIPNPSLSEPLVSHVNSNSEQYSAVELVWRSLEFSVPDKSGKKVILNSITGRVPPSSNCAIIGPSGSGKTSLLNILAGRVSASRNRSISGTISVDGYEIRPSKLRGQIAYVMQEDALTPTATPREAISFSAKLRLPQSMPSKEKNELVESTIKELGLEKCADTLIGSIMIKGISGGEKKRTAIGCELVTNPRILFLDEPTSGLDSFTALQVVRVLQKIAKDGCTVLCTIHQPSSEVFEEFSDVISLSRGNVLYNGPMANFAEYFEQLGYKCPERHNPADYVLYLSQTKDDETISKWGKRCSDTLSSSLDKQAIASSSSSAVASGGPSLVRFQVKTASIFTQLRYLLVREARANKRDKATLFSRFVVVLLLNLLFAVIFFQVGNLSDVQSHFGGLAQLSMGCLMYSSQPLLLLFPLERPIFLREYAVGTYSGPAYFFSKVLVDMFLSLITSCLVWVVTYWLMALKGNIFIMILATWLLSLVSSSLALVLGSIARDVKKAIEASAALLVPQMMFAGFFIKMEQIPTLLQWVQYLCALKFAVNMIMITEFGDNCVAGLEPLCEKLLDDNNVEKDYMFYYFAILCALFAALQLVALFFLTRLAFQ